MYLRVILLLALISSVHLLQLDKVQQSKRGVRECVPNTVFKKDCNTCVCNASGIAACTLMGCLGPNDILVKVASGGKAEKVV